MHDIDFSRGEAAMAYNSENGKPWHALGEPVNGAMTVGEALKLGKADFVATKVPVEGKMLLADDNGLPKETVVTDPDHSMVVRTDTMESLGVVGSRYTVVQMSEAFGFFDAALGEGAAAIDTVGMLNKGRTGFMLAKLPDSIEIVPGDRTERYLLFTNSFDGSSPVRCLFTGTRVVCNNTVQMAVGGARNMVKIRHTKSAPKRIKEAHKILQASESYWAQVQESLQRFAAVDVNAGQVDQFVADLLPGTKQDDGTYSVSTRTQNRRDAILEAFEESPGHHMAGKTAYGLWNAVTWFIDHDERHTVRKNTDRWEASLTGSGAKMRQKAYDLLAAIA